MLSLRKPKADSIRRFLAAQAKLDFTYSAVGTTAGQPPAGFVVDHTRVKLGEGEGVFLAARAGFSDGNKFALDGWRLGRRKHQFGQGMSSQSLPVPSVCGG